MVIYGSKSSSRGCCFFTPIGKGSFFGTIGRASKWWGLFAVRFPLIVSGLFWMSRFNLGVCGLILKAVPFASLSFGMFLLIKGCWCWLLLIWLRSYSMCSCSSLLCLRTSARLFWNIALFSGWLAFGRNCWSFPLDLKNDRPEELISASYGWFEVRLKAPPPVILLPRKELFPLIVGDVCCYSSFLCAINCTTSCMLPPLFVGDVSLSWNDFTERLLACPSPLVPLPFPSAMSLIVSL